MTAPEPDTGLAAGDWAAVLAALTQLRAEHATLTARLGELDHRVENIEGAFDAIEDTTPDTGLDMRELVPWVRDHIAQLLERRLPQNKGRLRWCRSWWLHPEAIARFDALHRSWTEAITADGGNALATYYDHLDRQLTTLMDEHGPFSACEGGHHGTERFVTKLGQVDPPPEYFFVLDGQLDHL
ncbi:hypothetical protein Ae168Ps1_6131 [Pseudonocardia sp. Ae168_Ps1]|uniref:DUF4913 domain-containing protein n=1 Tax=unclassified Pseudonocardia TaxID=2619320 RepID=UPI00094B10DA|nr:MULTISPECIES: DUF4913 domain-containing protein [unclassified Pseudonocardia]OLL70262.1 hypothetical protein Ae150APs1_6065 [Pseudonocardia sp. Ae150A_Ps1]OLL70535.1 hypothetical protein Ae263Ps1_6285 [Pseudonocardia sp. Ae263_Ps1]OLL70666.1 hypothetical protein Ae168Ps1_6131 [Pseudonocardia sp. Ae168_Ps1]OLL89236.1 hypothetical protein Ae356Ps1_6155c [Pseudonocardia sp. Ae356_Ps1]